MKCSINIFRHSLLAIPLAMLAGCGPKGPDLGQVTGTVTLDGRPVPAAFVVFTPQGSGRPSQTKTDQNGRFTLSFTASSAGALVGKHNVTISTADLTADEKKIPEIIPVKYHKKGSVEVVVEPGKNDIRLDLKSN